MTLTEQPSATAVPSAEEFRRIVALARRFLLAHADRLPANEGVNHRWLTDFIVFHAVQRTLALVWEQGMIVGAAVAWQTHTREVLAAARQNRDIFNWQPNDRTGDCVYLSLVIGTEPGVTRSAARYFLETYPEWRELKQFAHRRGKFVYARNLLNRLAGKEF